MYYLQLVLVHPTILLIKELTNANSQFLLHTQLHGILIICAGIFGKAVKEVVLLHFIVFVLLLLNRIHSLLQQLASIILLLQDTSALPLLHVIVALLMLQCTTCVLLLGFTALLLPSFIFVIMPHVSAVLLLRIAGVLPLCTIGMLPLRTNAVLHLCTIVLLLAYIVGPLLRSTLLEKATVFLRRLYGFVLILTKFHTSTFLYALANYTLSHALSAAISLLLHLILSSTMPHTPFIELIHYVVLLCILRCPCKPQSQARLLCNPA